MMFECGSPAAPPTGAINHSDLAFDDTPHFVQYHIADSMTKAIIDGFEIINIENT